MRRNTMYKDVTRPLLISPINTPNSDFGPPSHEPHNAYDAIRTSIPSTGVVTGPTGPTGPSPRPIELYPFLLLNVISTLRHMASILHSPLTGQYLYKVYAGPYVGNRSVNTADNPCFDDNSTAPSSNASNPETLVQQQVAQMEMYFRMTSYSCALVAVLVMAVLASVTSRRLLLIIPLIGYVGRCVVLYMVVSLDFGINWLYLSYVLESVAGGGVGFSFASYLYLSEITPSNGMRSFSIAILKCVQGFATAGLNILTGQLLEHRGFTLPAILSASCAVLAVLMALFMPHKTPKIEPADKSKPTPKGLFQKFKEPFTGVHKEGLKILVFLACWSYVIGTVGSVFTSGVSTLYLQRFPFCWSSGHFGWYDAVSSFSVYVFLMITMSLITKYSSGGVTMGIPGILMAAVSKILWAVASSDIYFYIGLAVGLPASIASILVQGETSRILGPKAQAPWFAIVIIIELICDNLTSPTIALYRWSLSINFPGLNFYICAFFYTIKALVLLVFQLKWRQFMARENRRDASTSTNEDCFIERRSGVKDAATNTEVDA